MIRVKLITDWQGYNAGEEIEIDKMRGKLLILSGQARPVVREGKEKAVIENKDVETRSA